MQSGHRSPDGAPPDPWRERPDEWTAASCARLPCLARSDERLHFPLTGEPLAGPDEMPRSDSGWRGDGRLRYQGGTVHVRQNVRCVAVPGSAGPAGSRRATSCKTCLSPGPVGRRHRGGRWPRGAGRRGSGPSGAGRIRTGHVGNPAFEGGGDFASQTSTVVPSGPSLVPLRSRDPARPHDADLAALAGRAARGLQG